MKSKIILNDVSKKYNNQWVLKNINHEFTGGYSYAFVGHNGCGKSTLIRILSKIITPTQGKVVYNKKLSFSYVPDKLRPIKLSARSYLKSMGEIQQIPIRKLENRIETLSKEFYIDEMLDVPMGGLSKGTLQKILVIQALLQDTDVVLLDEPLSGQDQESQKVFVKKINELRMKGATVFMSCHEKWLTEAISDEIYTFQNKKIVPYKQIVKSNNYLLLIERDSEKIPIWDGMIKYGTGYQISINEENVKNVIQKLWNDGWKVKGMYDEDSEIGKISAKSIF